MKEYQREKGGFREEQNRRLQREVEELQLKLKRRERECESYQKESCELRNYFEEQMNTMRS